MGLNRDDIIKALECCVKSECDKCPLRDGRCANGEMGRLSLTIIKELTEENERLRVQVKMWTSTAYCEKDRNESIKADTVRKMQERLKQAICDNTYPDFNRDGKPVNIWKATTGYDLIDQIAEEMLNDENNS